MKKLYITLITLLSLTLSSCVMVDSKISNDTGFGRSCSHEDEFHNILLDNEVI